MKNLLATLTATTILAAAGGAFAADETTQGESKVKYKDNGGYESTQSAEHTTAGGTTHSSDAKVDVDVDSKGRVDKTVKTDSVTDPKGLMNKKADTAKTEVEEKDRGGYKQTTTRKHTDAEGTNVTEKTSTDVDVDKNGNVTETDKTEKVTDPKGLMNKKKTVHKTKKVNGKVVEDKIDSNK